MTDEVQILCYHEISGYPVMSGKNNFCWKVFKMGLENFPKRVDLISWPFGKVTVIFSCGVCWVVSAIA